MCVRVEMMQNSIIRIVRKGSRVSCFRFRFESGFCPNIFGICVFIGIWFKVNAPGESPGAYFPKNMAGIIRKILENQRKVTLYEFALREIVCIICEQGHSVIPVLGDNIADRALQEVQRMVKHMPSLQKSEDQTDQSSHTSPNG